MPKSEGFPGDTPGGPLELQEGGIRLVHGLTKSTLITYFSGMKIHPKYAFLHAFFLICLSCSFQNLSIWPKTYPFFQILHVFASLNDVRTYSAGSWKTTLIMWIYGRAWYPPWHSSGPPPPPPPGDTQIIFWGGCAARGLLPLPISKDFSPSKKQLNWQVFLKFLQIRTHF